MNAGEISRLLNLHASTRNTFKGVFSSDTVPSFENITSKPAGIIINTDPSYLPGRHWVAAFFPYSGIPEYFDTRGFDVPDDKGFQDMIGDHYIYNSKMLQFPLSATCGQHCMNFIYERSKGLTYSAIIKSYDLKNTEQNDIKINRKIEQVFATDQKVIDLDLLTKQIGRQLHLSL